MKVIKIGGSVLTYKNKFKTLNIHNLMNVTLAIAQLWSHGYQDIVLIHGAGSFGHPFAKQYSLEGPITSAEQRLGVAKTHSSCVELSSEIVKTLIKKKVPAISIPPCSYVIQKNGRIVNFDLSCIIFKYLKRGYLPVTHGDVVPDIKLSDSVCSGDRLVSYLGKFASFVAMGTDVDGVLGDSGKVIPKISKSNFSSIMKSLKKVPFDVTGGMEGKIRELLELPSKSYIFNATIPERLIKLIKGRRTVCTEIFGSRKDVD